MNVKEVSVCVCVCGYGLHVLYGDASARQLETFNTGFVHVEMQNCFREQ